LSIPELSLPRSMPCRRTIRTYGSARRCTPLNELVHGRPCTDIDPDNASREIVTKGPLRFLLRNRNLLQALLTQCHFISQTQCLNHQFPFPLGGSIRPLTIP
jgi:hypothetical protein